MYFSHYTSAKWLNFIVRKHFIYYNIYYYFGQKLFLFRRKAMDDKKIKVERYIDINRNLKDELGRL